MSILARGIGAAAKGLTRGIETGQRLAANRYALDEMKRVEKAKKRMDEMDAAGPPKPRTESYPVMQRAGATPPAVGYETTYDANPTAIPTTKAGVPTRSSPDLGGIPQPEGATTFAAPVDLQEGDEVVSTETRTGFQDYATYRDEYLKHAAVVGGERGAAAREKFNKSDHQMILGVMFQNKVGIMNNDPIAMTNAMRSIAEIRPEFAGMSDRMYIGTDNTMRYQRGDKRSVDDPPVDKGMFMYAMQALPEVQDYLKVAAQIEQSMALTDYYDTHSRAAMIRAAESSQRIPGIDTKDVWAAMQEAKDDVLTFLPNDMEWVEKVAKGLKTNAKEFPGVPLRNAEDIRQLVVSITQDMVADNYRLQEPGSPFAAPPPRTASMVYTDTKHLVEWLSGSKDSIAPEMFPFTGADGREAYYVKMPSGRTYRFRGDGNVLPMIIATERMFQRKNAEEDEADEQAALRAAIDAERRRLARIQRGELAQESHQRSPGVGALGRSQFIAPPPDEEGALPGVGISTHRRPGR